MTLIATDAEFVTEGDRHRIIGGISATVFQSVNIGLLNEHADGYGRYIPKYGKIHTV